MKLEDPASSSHYGFDDEVLCLLVVLCSTRANQLQVEFNTQASSQWDSFGASNNSPASGIKRKRITPNPAHFMHLPTGLTYNGAKPTIDAFQTPESAQHLPTLDRKEKFQRNSTLTLKKANGEKTRLAPTRLCDRPRRTNRLQKLRAEPRNKLRPILRFPNRDHRARSSGCLAGINLPSRRYPAHPIRRNRDAGSNDRCRAGRCDEQWQDVWIGGE